MSQYFILIRGGQNEDTIYQNVVINEFLPKFRSKSFFKGILNNHFCMYVMCRFTLP